MKFAASGSSIPICLPPAKLTFMGAELAQWNEWHYEYSLDWHLLQYEPHRQTQEFFKAANAFYLEQPALWEAG